MSPVMVGAASAAAELTNQITTGTLTRGSLTDLFMECVDEDLAPSQKEAGRKAATEYQLAVEQVQLAHGSSAQALAATRSVVPGGTRAVAHRGRPRAGKQTGRGSNISASTVAAASTQAAHGRGVNRGGSVARGTRAVAPITIAPGPTGPVPRSHARAIAPYPAGLDSQSQVRTITAVPAMVSSHRGPVGGSVTARGGRGTAVRGRGRRRPGRMSAPAAPGKVITHQRHYRNCHHLSQEYSIALPKAYSVDDVRPTVLFSFS